MRGILIFLLLHVTITIVGQQLEEIGGAMRAIGREQSRGDSISTLELGIACGIDFMGRLLT